MGDELLPDGRQVNHHVIFAGMPIPLRLVLVKRHQRVKKLKKGRLSWRTKTYFYGIVTNISRKEKTPAQIYRFYHKRASIEHFFRDLSAARQEPGRRFTWANCPRRNFAACLTPGRQSGLPVVRRDGLQLLYLVQARGLAQADAKTHGADDPPET